MKIKFLSYLYPFLFLCPSYMLLGQDLDIDYEPSGFFLVVDQGNLATVDFLETVESVARERRFLALVVDSKPLPSRFNHSKYLRYRFVNDPKLPNLVLTAAQQFSSQESLPIKGALTIYEDYVRSAAEVVSH